MSKIMAIDIGEKRIGVALSDGLHMFAHPFKTIAWQGIEALTGELNRIISDEDVTLLIIGIPYTMQGGHSQRTEQVLQLTEELKQRIDVPIKMADERLTTVMAEKALHRVGKKPSKHRQMIDQIAAVYILQNYLDMNKD